MMRATTAAVLILLLAVLPTGCERAHRSNPYSVLLASEEEPNVPATQSGPDSAWPPEMGRDAAGGRKPAVLFVAFEATPDDVVDRMLKVAKVTKDDTVCDLGCGDGRIVVAAAKEYGCKAVGYDLDHLRVQEAREKVQKNRVAHLVRIEQKDVLQADLRQATVVTLYLGRELNERLISQLRQLPPGARIVSHDFGLKGIPPDRTIEMSSRFDDRKHKIHLWTCPLPPQSD